MPRKRIAYKYQINKRIRWYGTCDYDNQVITINPAKGDVINTIIHEDLHRKHPSWNEKRVIDETKKVETRLTIKQSRDLLDDLLRKIKNK